MRPDGSGAQRILIAGYQQLGSPANTASDFGTSVTEVADTLTWVRGRHTVKAGLDWRWERVNVLQPPSPTGSFTFSNLFTDLPGTANTGTPLASFLLGQVQQFSIDLQQDQIRNRAHFQEYFLQDDWRLGDRVTLNAGLRYTLNFPSTEVNDQVGVFNLATRQMEYAGQNGVPRAARQLHWNNLGPRLGLAVQATDSTVVRAGYGVVDGAGFARPTISSRRTACADPGWRASNASASARASPTRPAAISAWIRMNSRSSESAPLG